MCVAKNISRIINTIASIWSKHMLEYLSLDIICSAKPTVFIELRSVRFRNCSLLGTNNLRRQNYEHISLPNEGKVCIRTNCCISAGAYPGFHSMKQLGIFLHPPGWEATESIAGLPPALNSPVPISKPVGRESSVLPKNKSPVRGWTYTA